VNALFLTDLWSYLGSVSDSSVSSRFSTLWGSWSLLLFTFVNSFGFLFTLFMLYRQSWLAINNLTTNESINSIRYDHFHGIKLDPTGNLSPTFRNPFDLGSRYCGEVNTCALANAFRVLII
jgi:hypothetical protein